MGCAMIKVFKKNGQELMYLREAVWVDYTRGYISVHENAFLSVTSISGLIKKLESNKIINYTDDFIEIDKFIGSLIERYGEDFVPDPDGWYNYIDRTDIGADGSDTDIYLNEYFDNKRELEKFIDELKKLKEDDIEKITLSKEDYDDEMDEDDVEPETWCLISENGKFVKG